MSFPLNPPAETSESRPAPGPPKSGYLIANFLFVLAGCFQLFFASGGALGVYAYATASPSQPEAYQANIAAIAVFPLSLGLALIGAFAYRVLRTRVYKPVGWWFAVTSLLPLLMVIASFVVTIFFDGPPMF
jgi:hypothetical protein